MDVSRELSRKHVNLMNHHLAWIFERRIVKSYMSMLGGSMIFKEAELEKAGSRRHLRIL
jgi:hypothetical protein